MAAGLGLVDYYSSSSEDEPSAPLPKKRKTSAAPDAKNDLPPLPATFLDQYSSTVRASAQDDPSLHGGRKRVTPHVQGNWPTHVYLEWHPDKHEAQILADVVTAAQTSRRDGSSSSGGSGEQKHQQVHSLLENSLGVALPLHISLSRPLTLKTEQKDGFLSRVQKAVGDSSVASFRVVPKDLAWHANENGTRWFLVLRLQRSAEAETTRLLDACNAVAGDFDQPLLYADQDAQSRGQTSKTAEKFHISLAWSLSAPAGRSSDDCRRSQPPQDEAGVPYELLGRVGGLNFSFAEVKVRIGQGVHSVPLKAARRRMSAEKAVGQ